ncbi:DUF3048 domain-containing protein [Rhabdothermincola sediminis]|uniref:DUF3048 domain-containing protein n=1 Tax=Rhabdothermincola sediminis TaxID=2751370 RepID=UPI001AA0AE8F|nr:DUF3048 domain-containing protein [Rhabdothermincola sediminis]
MSATSGRRRAVLAGGGSLAGGLLAAAVFLLAARGGEQVEQAGPGAPVAETTTTVPAPAPLAPLTGLPADPAALERVALVVKIDNAEGLARPQAGINQADVVIEEKVEGNISRFVAVFHSTDAPLVGPVRSARTTDLSLIDALDRPLFAYSGANRIFLELVRAAPLVDVGFDAAPSDYERLPGRKAPNNLFTSTPALWARAPAGGSPPAPFASFAAPGSRAVPPAGALPAATGGFSFGATGTRIEYRWDPSRRGWLRWQNGTEHVDTDGSQVAPANVIVQFVRYVDSGARDSAGNPVPEAETTGEGDALVFTEGAVIAGTWSRPDPTRMAAYQDAAGQPVTLTAGRTWVALVPVGTNVDVG